jgi:hypothetical protein
MNTKFVRILRNILKIKIEFVDIEEFIFTLINREDIFTYLICMLYKRNRMFMRECMHLLCNCR